MNKIIYFIIATVWLISDQWTKNWSVIELEEKERIIDVLPILQLRYAENTGAAFGLFADQGGWQKWFFLCVGAIAIIALIVTIIKAPKGQYFAIFGYASILGGAIGNVYDRLMFGYVRDMIHVYYEPIYSNFPIFNVADTAISVGVGALIVDWVLSMINEKETFNEKG